MKLHWNPEPNTGRVVKTITYISNIKFVQNYAARCLLSLLSACVKLYVASMLCMAFTVSPLVDFFIQILVTVFIHFAWSQTCVRIVTTNARALQIDRCARQIVSNMTRTKIETIKRVAVFATSIVLVIILCMIEITSHMLIIYIVQNVIIVVVVDILGKINWSETTRSIKNHIHKKYEWTDSQRAVHKQIDENIVINETYFPEPPAPSTTIIKRVRNGGIRKFRFTSVFKYIFPNKY